MMNWNSNNPHEASGDYLKQLGQLDKDSGMFGPEVSVNGPTFGMAPNTMAGGGWMDFFKGDEKGLDWLTGGTRTDGSKFAGVGGLGLGIAKTGLDTWLGMKQLDAAEDQLAFQKNSFNKNYAAQKTTANEQLNWRNTFRKQTNPDYDKPAPQIA